MTEHRRFTVSETAYLRNLDPDELIARCVAVHYEDAPVETPTGQSFSMRFPMLILPDYLNDVDAVAAKVAAILEKHWDEEGAA